MIDCTTLKSFSPSSAASVTVLVPFCSTPGGTLNVLVMLAWLLKLITPSDAPFSTTLTLCGWSSVVPCSVTSNPAGIDEFASKLSIASAWSTGSELTTAPKKLSLLIPFSNAAI